MLSNFNVYFFFLTHVAILYINYNKEKKKNCSDKTIRIFKIEINKKKKKTINVN